MSGWDRALAPVLLLAGCATPGCRIKVGDRAFQACNDTAAWPFADVANAAAAAAPDLVIHVGDYHYGDNACPYGNTGCAGGPWGYGWDAWEADAAAPR